MNRPDFKPKFNSYSRNNRVQGNIRSGNINTNQTGMNKSYNFVKKNQLVGAKISYGSLLKEWNIHDFRCLYCLNKNHETKFCTNFTKDL